MEAREIKFRGKRKDNGEWVEGYYVKHPFSDFPETPVDCIIADSFPHEVLPETVQIEVCGQWFKPEELIKVVQKGLTVQDD